MSDILPAALEAYDAGLCVIRAATDGTKAPGVTRAAKWTHYQKRRPNKPDIEDWFGTRKHPGMGIVCGAISGNLEMLEFEGRAIDEGIMAAYNAAAKDAGLGELLQRIADGYSERTPSGGAHFLYRCDQIGGNTPLARRPSTPEELAADPGALRQVLIETRGEGGFAVVAPSNGTTHRSGGAWVRVAGSFATIATITPEERQAIHDLARTFDQCDETPSEAPRVRSEPRNGAPGTEDPWDHFDAHNDCHGVLGAAGFIHTGRAARGTNYTRPGKDPRHGSSATVWDDDGTATLFSTSINAPDEYVTGHRKLRPWQLHVALNHAGDYADAARTYRIVIGPGKREEFNPEGLEGGREAPEAEDKTPTDLPVIPDEFWEARDQLGHVRSVARARRIAPDTLLGMLMARVAALTPHTVKLPAVIGSPVGLSFYVAAVGRSGQGKTAGSGTAAEMAPSTDEVREITSGTGEGLLEALYETDKENGRHQARHALIVTIDEGSQVFEIGQRTGSTTMSVIRSAWNDAPLGSANADPARRRHIPRGQAAYGITIGIQPAKAGPLLDDIEYGTPQRFLWVSSADPAMPDETPEPIDHLDPWTAPSLQKRESVVIAQFRRHIIGIPESVRAEIVAAHVARHRGTEIPDPLDGHAGLVKLKAAAILAILDGRYDMNEEDWRLAGILYATSSAVRTYVVDTIAQVSKMEEAARRRTQVARAIHEASEMERRALNSGAQMLARRVHRMGEAKRRDLHAAVASRHRAVAPLHEMIGKAEDEEWIRRTGDGSWVPGRRRP